MKKIKLLFVAFATALGGLASLSSVKENAIKKTEAAAGLISNKPTDWVKIAGGQESSEITNGLKWTNFGGTWSASYYQQKVKLDGLSFKFSSYYEDNTSNAVFGAFFHSTILTQLPTINFKPVVNVWPNLYDGQTRWNISPTYDRSNSCCYLDEACTEIQKFTKAGTGISTSDADHEYSGFTINFTKVSETAYKVELLDDFKGFWYSVTGTPGTGFDEDKTKYTAYIKTSDLDLDEDGYTYMYLFGSHMSAEKGDPFPTFYFENFKAKLDESGLGDEELNTFISDINSIDPNDYDNSLREQISQIKAAALIDLESATTIVQASAIVKDAKDAVDALFNHYALFDQDFTTTDEDANFYCCWGGPSTAKRFNDEGGISAYLQNGYGNRSEFKRKYSITNFEMVVNISDLPTQKYLIINAASKAQSYITEDTYFHLEFGKDSQNKPFFVFGNTGTHNISFDDFGTVTDGSYKGKNVVAPIHTYHIKLTSDKATMKSTLTVNDITYNFDTINILKNNANNFDNKAYYTIGLMNSSKFGHVLIEKFEDADSKAYAESLQTNVQTIKTNVQDLANNLPEVGTGLTSETYDDYVSAYEQFLTGYNSEIAPLMDYDVIHFEISKIKEDAYAPIFAYDLKVYINGVIEDLNQYVAALSSNDYSPTNWNAINTIVSSAIQDLEDAENQDAVDAIYDQAVSDIDEVSTLADDALSAKKVSAKNDLDNYVDAEDYDEEDATAIAGIISGAKDDIDAATSIADIDTIVADAKEDIDAFKTIEQKEAEELAELKISTKAELENYLVLTDYYEEQQNEINIILEDAFESIDLATTSTAVLTIKLTTETALDAILNKTQMEAKNLADAKANARTTIQNYVNLADYKTEEQTEIRNLIIETREDIDACRSVAEVTSLINNFKALVDSKKTKAQYEAEELEAAKTAAFEELETFYEAIDTSKYSNENASEIDSKYVTVGQDILNATTKEQVAQLVNEYKALVASLPEAPKGGCGGSLVTSVSLISILSIIAVSGLLVFKKKEM